MRRRSLTDEQQRHLMTRGSALAVISQHPSWDDLVEEIDAKEERLKRTQIAKVLSKAPVDQREVDFVRGFIAGMRYLLSIPENAEGRLEAYLKEHAAEGASR